MSSAYSHFFSCLRARAYSYIYVPFVSVKTHKIIDNLPGLQPAAGINKSFTPIFNNDLPGLQPANGINKSSTPIFNNDLHKKSS